MMAVLEQKKNKEDIQKEVEKNLNMLNEVAFVPWSFNREQNQKDTASFCWRQQSESNVIGIQVRDILLENLKKGKQYHDAIAERLSNIPIQFCWIKTKDFSIHFYPVEKKIIFSKPNEEERGVVFFDQNFFKKLQRKITELFEEMQKSGGTITLTEY